MAELLDVVLDIVINYCTLSLNRLPAKYAYQWWKVCNEIYVIFHQQCLINLGIHT
jgi:hypothetical protein